MDSAKFQRHFPDSALGEFFSSGARAVVGGPGTLYLLSGAVGGHPGLGISFGRSTCPVGRSGDLGNFFSVTGHADGP